MVAGVGFVACTQEDEASVQSGIATAEREVSGNPTVAAAKEDVKDAAASAKQQAREAWASIRTDGERWVDRIQTRGDTGAKQELLNACRDALERLRKDNAGAADRVDRLCTRIRDTDVSNSSAWNEIQSELNRLDAELSR